MISFKVSTTINRPVEIVVDSGHSTGVTIEWSGQGKILILKLMLPFLRRGFMRQCEQELEIFKNLVETRWSNFSVTKKKTD